MSWERPDGGQVCYITGNREACMERFTSSLEPGEHLLVAVDPDGRPVALLAVPELSRGRGLPSISECFMGGGLEGLLDLHIFGTVLGPLDPDRG